MDVDPDAMRAHGVTLDMVFKAVKMSNLDVGARTIEINKAEYVIRGIGFLKSLEDIENTVVKTGDNVPILVKHVATVKLGPALRKVLDKEGAKLLAVLPWFVMEITLWKLLKRSRKKLIMKSNPHFHQKL